MAAPAQAVRLPATLRERSALRVWVALRGLLVWLREPVPPEQAARALRAASLEAEVSRGRRLPCAGLEEFRMSGR
jgi:hypothetical protein